MDLPVLEPALPPAPERRLPDTGFQRQPVAADDAHDGRGIGAQAGREEEVAHARAGAGPARANTHAAFGRSV
ncbi:MAG: hypothetical protein J0H05_16140, partial [Stenotrophomonas acidaminiphila]|nr:hypothetical protein [Stenotrophomonas acidaminiphila]